MGVERCHYTHPDEELGTRPGHIGLGGGGSHDHRTSNSRTTTVLLHLGNGSGTPNRTRSSGDSTAVQELGRGGPNSVSPPASFSGVPSARTVPSWSGSCRVLCLVVEETMRVATLTLSEQDQIRDLREQRKRYCNAATNYGDLIRRLAEKHFSVEFGPFYLDRTSVDSSGKYIILE